MIYSRMKKWALEKGWKVDKSCVYGDNNGYIFTVFDEMGSKTFITYLPNLSEQQSGNLTVFLKSNKRGLKISEYALEGEMLAVKFKESFRSIRTEEMQNFLDELTGFFKDERVPGKEICSNCGAQGDHDLTFVNNIVMSMCDECYQQVLDETNEVSKEYAYEEKNYISGILGAMLGGLIASIPWVILGLLGWMASILGYAIGWASLKGYYLFKGKVGQATKWILVVTTLLCVFIAELVSISIMFIQADAAIVLENYVIAFTDPEIAPGIWIDLALGTGMALWGISPILRQVKSDMESIIPNIRKASA